MTYFTVRRDPENPRDIEYNIPSNVDKVPDELLAYKREVEEVASVLRGMFPKDVCKADPEVQACFDEYMVRLVANAQMGLTGETPSPTVARDDLQVIQRELHREVDHAGRHAAKERLLRVVPNLLFLLSALSVTASCYFAYLRLNGSTTSAFLGSQVNTTVAAVAALFFALVFAGTGLWRYLAAVSKL
jgi:hypothetical protein